MSRIGQIEFSLKRELYAALEKAPAQYVFATLLVALALALRLAIFGLNAGYPYFTFYPAITVVALTTRPGPAIYSIGLSGLFCDYFFLEPYGSLRMKPEGLISLVVFLVASLFIAFCVHVSRRGQLERGRLAAIVSGSDLPIIGKTLDGTITSWNRAAGKLLGYTAGEAIGKSITLIFPDELKAEEQEILARVGCGEQIVQYETVRQRKDGSRVEVAVSISPVYDRAGRIAAASTILHDLTERRRRQNLEKDIKEIDRNLSLSEERYRSLVRATAQIVWSASPSGEMVGEQPDWQRYTGQRADEYTGLGWLNALHEEDRQRVSVLWGKAVTARALYETEYRLRRGDGVVRYVAARGVPVFENDGEIREWVGTCTDITHQHEVQKKLEEAEKRFRTLFESSPDTYFILEPPEGRISDCNPSAERLLGMSRVELLGRCPADLSLNDSTDRRLPAEATSEHIAAALRYGTDRFERQLRLRDGSRCWVDVLLSVIRLEARPVVLASWREIEDRKKLEAELERTIARLGKSNADLEEFAYVASHDLRAPLRAVQNLSQWLEDDLGERLPESSARNLRLLRGRVARMEALLDGILAYSRAGRVDYALEPVDLRALIDEMGATDWGGRRVAIELRRSMEFETAAVPLRQVVQNLIGNAVKHHDREAVRIVVDVAERDEQFEFSVTDDGPGIAEEYREKVFGLFRTLRPRDEVEGSGIGLSIVRKLVLRYGGRVWIESAAPRGASIHFTWPKQLSRLEGEKE